MHDWDVLTERILHWHILKRVSAFVFSQDTHQYVELFSQGMFIKAHLNMLIELWPNPGLV